MVYLCGMNIWDLEDFDVIPFQGFNVPLDGGIPIPSQEGIPVKITVSINIGDGGVELQDLNLSWTKDIPKSEKKLNNKGGGAQLDVSETTIDPKIKEALEKLAEGKVFKKQKGLTHWDGVLLSKNLLTHRFNRIESSKHQWQPRKVYFFVDTSGSVWYLADLIIKLIKSTNTSKTIRVYSGSEAHPNKDENTGTTVSKRKSYLDQGISDLFKNEKPEAETSFVFWGDLQMAGVRVKELREILKPYNCIWLNPSDTKYDGCESEKMQKICPVYFGMNSVNKIVRKLKQII